MKNFSNEETVRVKAELKKKLTSFITSQVSKNIAFIRSAEGGVISIINEYQLGQKHGVRAETLLTSDFGGTMMCIGIDQTKANTWFVSEDVKDGIINFPNLRIIPDFEEAGFHVIDEPPAG